jgi:hypothetical protein
MELARSILGDERAAGAAPKVPIAVTVAAMLVCDERREVCRCGADIT